MPRHDPETAAQEIERDLRAIREIVRRPLDSEIARGELTGPQLSAMTALVRSGGMTVKELSHALGLAHSTTSGIVDRLEKRGLVERRQDEADRRLTRVVLSQSVSKFLRETLPKLSMHPLVEAMRSAKPAERAAILDGLKTLRCVLERRHADSQGTSAAKWSATDSARDER